MFSPYGTKELLYEAYLRSVFGVHVQIKKINFVAENGLKSKPKVANPNCRYAYPIVKR